MKQRDGGNWKWNCIQSKQNIDLIYTGKMNDIVSVRFIIIHTHIHRTNGIHGKLGWKYIVVYRCKKSIECEQTFSSHIQFQFIDIGDCLKEMKTKITN